MGSIFKINKNFSSVKDAYKRIKRQTTEWEKIFTYHIPNKRVISRKYKELSKLMVKIKQSNFKMDKIIKGYFTQEVIQVANKPMKRYSTSSVIKELQIKTMKYYYMPIRMTNEKNSDTTNAGKDGEKLDYLYIASGYIKLFHSGK